MPSGGDARQRLNEIWTEWGLQPELAQSDAQFRALEVVGTWLKRGETEPEIVIRAAQVLLAEPERPDGNKRECWKGLQRALIDAWSNAGTAPERMVYSQALLLAAWQGEVRAGWFGIAPLLDSAWDVMKARERQEKELSRWRTRIQEHQFLPVRPATSGGTETIEQRKLGDARFVLPETAIYAGVDTDAIKTQIQSFEQHVRHYGMNHSQLAGLFAACNTAIEDVGAGLKQVYGALGQYAQAFESFANELHSRTAELANKMAESHARYVQSEGERNRHDMDDTQKKLNLLWWGQSRFCKAEHRPYRRMQNPDTVLWWASREAAELSTSVEVEPAAAYLVETLHSLGQDVFEKKPLRAWIEELHGTLVRASRKLPAISDRLAKIAGEDALGLPVTWVRLKATNKEPLTGAADTLAIDLDAEIDRGQWASWIFRESLLDLRLGQPA